MAKKKRKQKNVKKKTPSPVAAAKKPSAPGPAFRRVHQLWLCTRIAEGFPPREVARMFLKQFKQFGRQFQRIVDYIDFLTYKSKKWGTYLESQRARIDREARREAEKLSSAHPLGRMRIYQHLMEKALDEGDYSAVIRLAREIRKDSPLTFDDAEDPDHARPGEESDDQKEEENIDALVARFLEQTQLGGTDGTGSGVEAPADGEGEAEVS